MTTWIFWVLAATAVVSSVLVITRRHVLHTAAALLGLSASLSGLYLLLAGPVTAALLLLASCAGIATMCVPVLLWPSSGSDGEWSSPGASVTRRIGVILAVILVLELGWAFRRTAGSDMPARSSVSVRSVPATADTTRVDHLAALAAGGLLLMVSVLGLVAFRREVR